MVVASFLDYWGSLPWETATMPLQSPASIADLSAGPAHLDPVKRVDFFDRTTARNPSRLRNMLICL